VKLLANPLFMRMALGFVLGLAAFVAGIVLLRMLKRQILEDEDLTDTPGKENTLYPYSVVIQQLKQQKFELQTEQKVQQRRAKTSEQITSAVLANLPCGVLFLAPNGLVKQVNAAARKVLGFASPLGMGADELFRDAEAFFDSGPAQRVADVFKAALRGQVPPPFESHYRDASGAERTLAFTLIALSSATGEALGLAALVTDQSANAHSRREEILQREIAAEMALELRNSLAAIRHSAEQISSVNNQPETSHLANDISSETERLERLVGGFLAGNPQVKASAAGV